MSKNIAIYGRKITKQNIGYFEAVLNLLDSMGWNAVLEYELKAQLVKKAGIGDKCKTFKTHSDLKSGIDLAISVGGDGTFIQTVKYIRDSGVPVTGVNMGRLGFLANVNSEDLEKTFDKIKNGQFDYQKRSLLRVHTSDNIFDDNNIALNEVTLHKKDTSSMITVHATLGDLYLNSYWADGLIVATPTGSTAYNLSCGGPIVTPGCQVHILNPIAPHNLSLRPLVVPDHFPIKLSVEGRERKYLLSLDSISKNIDQDEEVIVTKAEFLINVVKFEDASFLDTIRNKMSWGVDKRN
ncbi:MAG: kinase [Crocinitomicaceae bacterium]|jgi:NAD+ kinase|nr:kinase [Crocinitomicaceae bacterium]